MAYTREIKAVAIKMMLPPNSKPLSHIYEQTNIPIATLTKWREELRKNGHAAPTGEEQSEKWSSRPGSSTGTWERWSTTSAM